MIKFVLLALAMRLGNGSRAKQYDFSRLQHVLAENVFLDRIYFIRKDGQLDFFPTRHKLWQQTLEDVVDLAQIVDKIINTEKVYVGPETREWIKGRVNYIKSFNSKWIFRIDMLDLSGYTTGLTSQLYSRTPLSYKATKPHYLVPASKFDRKSVLEMLQIDLYIENLSDLRKSSSKPLRLDDRERLLELAEASRKRLADAVYGMLLNPLQGTETSDRIIEALEAMKDHNSAWRWRINMPDQDVSGYPGSLLSPLLRYLPRNAV